MANYKIVCINLDRRQDRREYMTKLFESQDITNYEFFSAVDGTDMIATEQSQPIYLFKHYTRLKQGTVGCALSHYNIWRQLMTDWENSYYVIIEDDITLGINFRENLSKIISKITPEKSIILLGMTVPLISYQQSRSVYAHDTSYTLHRLNTDLYCGGAFGYIINKYAATKLLSYIQSEGIKMAIDWLMFRCGPPIYETHPHLVFTDAVQESLHHVDSDIQHNDTLFTFTKIVNNYVFDDYVFFPNKDSMAGDIREIYADIPFIKKMADSTSNCVAFNTYGWLKREITSFDKFINIDNKYHTVDGIYIKKSAIFGR